MGGLTEAKFTDKGMRRIAQQYFGDTRLAELLKPSLFTAYNLLGRQNFFFRQHRAVQYPHEDFLLRDMIRGCSAAPIIFPVARVRSMANRLYHFIDGGIFAYNPAACAYTEVRKLHSDKHARDMVMLSLSGGTYINVELPDDNDRDWGAWEWMSAIHYIASASQVGVVNSQMEQMFLTCENRNQYLRIHPGSKMDAMQLDETNPKTLRTMCATAAQVAEQYDRRLDAFVDLLTKEASQLSAASEAQIGATGS